jgi:hypothetical protein
MNRIANIAPKISVLVLPFGRPRNGIACVTPRISAIGACDCQFGKVEILLIFFLNSQLFNYGLFCPQSPSGHTQKTRIKIRKLALGGLVCPIVHKYVSIVLRHSTRDEKIATIERDLIEWRDDCQYCMNVLHDCA